MCERNLERCSPLSADDPDRAGVWPTPPGVWSLGNKLGREKLPNPPLARVSRDMARETEPAAEVPGLFNRSQTATYRTETWP